MLILFRCFEHVKWKRYHFVFMNVYSSIFKDLRIILSFEEEFVKKY